MLLEGAHIPRLLAMSSVFKASNVAPLCAFLHTHICLLLPLFCFVLF